MNNFAAEYDARLLADARALSNLTGNAEIRAYFASIDHELDERDDPYAAALGRLQAVTHELACWIGRLNA